MTDKQQEQPNLDPQHELFVGYYMQLGDATKAAKKAGYSAKTASQQGYRLLRNVQIQAEIKRRLAEIMPPAEIMLRLADQARNASLEKFFTIGEETVVIDTEVRLERITDEDEDGNIIKTKMVKRTITTETAKRPVVLLDLRKAKKAGALRHMKKYSKGPQGERIELHDSQAALVQLGKFHGLWDRGPAGTEDDPIHSVQHSVEEWLALREKQTSQAAETMAAFESNGADEDEADA